jgi:hypothetical protein
MGPSLRTWELESWCRSRRIDKADEPMLRAVFEERDRLREALEQVLIDVEAVARMRLVSPGPAAEEARLLLEETAP